MIGSMGMIRFMRTDANMHDRVIDSNIDSNIDSKGDVGNVVIMGVGYWGCWGMAVMNDG